MALAFKLWWCPWSIRLGQRLPFGTSYALMVVLLINFIQSWRLFSDHLSTVSVVLSGAIATEVTRLTDAAGWKIACGMSFGTIGTRWSGGNPPLQGHNLGALLLDSLICWLAWLSLSFVSLFTMRDLVGYRRLLACWPGSSSFFDLLSLDKSSSVLLFLIGRLVGNFCLFFAWLSNLTTVVLLLAAGGGEELLFRVVVKRVLMMLWWSGSSSF